MQGQLEYQEHPMLLMPRDFEVQNVTRRPPGICCTAGNEASPRTTFVVGQDCQRAMLKVPIAGDCSMLGDVQ